MPLTETDALTAYAKALNTLNAEDLWPLLAEDFEYCSQRVLLTDEPINLDGVQNMTVLTDEPDTVHNAERP